MEEIMKNNLENGCLRVITDTMMIDVAKSEGCEHYDLFMIGSNGSIYYQHIKTIQELAKLPFRWQEFDFIKHPDGKVVGVIQLGEGEIPDNSFHGN